MFNTGDDRVPPHGSSAVFFGSNLIGQKLPSLTYMLVFGKHPPARRTGRFVGDPEWKTLSTTPGITDAEIVTNITSFNPWPARSRSQAADPVEAGQQIVLS